MQAYFCVYEVVTTQERQYQAYKAKKEKKKKKKKKMKEEEEEEEEEEVSKEKRNDASRWIKTIHLSAYACRRVEEW